MTSGRHAYTWTELSSPNAPNGPVWDDAALFCHFSVAPCTLFRSTDCWAGELFRVTRRVKAHTPRHHPALTARGHASHVELQDRAHRPFIYRYTT